MVTFDVPFNDYFFIQGHALKKEADNLTHNQTLKIKKYMEASIQWVTKISQFNLLLQTICWCFEWSYVTHNSINLC